MIIRESDIQRLKQELLDDLRALERVETIFAKRRNGTSRVAETDVVAASPVSPSQERLIIASETKPSRGSLIKFVTQAFKAAAPGGLRPRQVVEYVKRCGYPFSSDEIAASSVSTALQRLYKRDKKLEKLERGEYLWKG